MLNLGPATISFSVKCWLTDWQDGMTQCCGLLTTNIGGKIAWLSALGAPGNNSTHPTGLETTGTRTIALLPAPPLPDSTQPTQIRMVLGGVVLKCPKLPVTFHPYFKMRACIGQVTFQWTLIRLGYFVNMEWENVMGIILIWPAPSALQAYNVS